MIAHCVDGVRRFATRTGDARIVEEDYGTPLRKPVRHKRIPVVKAGEEVLKEDERCYAFRAEAPVCVADSIGLDETGWSRDVGVFRHIYLRSGCYFRNWGPSQRMRLSNSHKDAVDRFTASGGRDIPRLLGCDKQMPSRVKANPLDDGVVDTLGSVGAMNDVHAYVPTPPTPYMIWIWPGLPATARMSQSRHARASS